MALAQDLADTAAPDRHRGHTRRLRDVDVAQVCALYRFALSNSPAGHLAERSDSELASAITSPTGAASVGVWIDDVLVGYSLCSVDGAERAWDSPLIRRIAARREKLWTGSGTVVHPDFHGLHLMRKLLQARTAEIARQGPLHTAGLIAVGNLASLMNAMRAGGWIVGLHHDGDCQNYILYAGIEKDRVALDGQASAVLAQDSRIASLLASGWIGTQIDRNAKDKTRGLFLRRLVNAEGN